MTAPDRQPIPSSRRSPGTSTHLLDGGGDDPHAAVDALLADAQRRADAFAAALRRQGRRARRRRPRRGDARARRDRRSSSAAPAPTRRSRFSIDTADPAARRAAAARPGEGRRAIETTLLFFELEWAALDDDARRGAARHRRARLRPPPPAHRAPLPPAPADRARGEDPRREGAHRPHRVGAAVRGADVGDRGRRSPDGAEPVVARGRARRGCSRPTARCAAHAAERVTAALAARACARAPTSSTRCSPTRWSTTGCAATRTGWPAATSPTRPPTSRSQALIEAVRARYELPRRWYRLKAQLLGLDRLADYDRMAAVTQEDEQVAWPRGRATSCSTSYARVLAPSSARLVERFFDERWIDAPVRPGKRGGAFCAYTRAVACTRTCCSTTPRRRRDVLTLAHELGHGVHAALGAPPGRLPHGDAADAGRDRVGVRRDARLRAPARAGRRRRSRGSSLLAERIEGSIATVFRQVAMNRFEHLVHTERRERGRARASTASASCGRESQEELLGDAVEVTEGYRSWWSYVPHFIGTPGYVYAYAYGQLLALAVYGRYEEEGAASCPPTSSCSRAGGSTSPEELGADRRRRPRRPGLLGHGPRPRRAPARRGRAGRAGRRPDLTRRQRPLAALSHRERRASSTLIARRDGPRERRPTSSIGRARRPRARARCPVVPTITAGMPRAREQAHVGAPGHAGDRRVAPSSALHRGARPSATHGWSGGVSPGANAPPVQSISTGGASPSSSTRLERGRAPAAEVRADAARRARPSNSSRSGTELDHSPPLRPGRRSSG